LIFCAAASFKDSPFGRLVGRFLIEKRLGQQ